MRTFLIATFLMVAVFSGGFAYLSWEAKALQTFCSGLAVGSSITQVREAAREAGFKPGMESFRQMRVIPMRWDPSGRSCRIFFNPEKTLEYRVFQEGA